MEVYGVFKPYHAGISGTYPEGSDDADATSLKRVGGTLWYVSPIMERYPYLREKRRPVALPPDLDTLPVRRIVLRKKDDRPTRVGGDDLQIWTSHEQLPLRAARRPLHARRVGGAVTKRGHATTTASS